MQLKQAAVDFRTRLAAGDPLLIQRMMWVLAVAVITLYLSPYIILGDQNKWMIWDNLDSNYVAYKVLIDSGELFADNSTIVEQPLGGVPRSTLPSEFDAFVWLYLIFGPQAAYIINRIAMTVVAFLGMYLLLKKHILSTKNDEPISVGVALCFAILPFWPFGGLSVAGQPLVLYALLNLRNGGRAWQNWLFVVLYPFYSSLVLSGVFFLVMVSIIWLYDVSKGRKPLWLFAAIVAISLGYVISNYRLFLSFLISPDFVSHRVEFRSAASSFRHALRDAYGLFYHGQPHAHSLQSLIVLPIVAASFLLVAFSGTRRYRLLYIVILSTLILVSVFFGFKSWPPFASLIQPILALLPMQFDRFYFLGPMLWMIIFAVSLVVVTKFAPTLRLILIAVVCVQVLFAAAHHELIANRGSPAVGAFFARSQFEMIKETIGKPVHTYRVASIGIHPSVALYNGFYTLDGYWPNYSLEYKHQFREIIAGELEKTEWLREYFDFWGSRVYMFNHVTESNMVVTSGNDIVLRDLAYNWDAFHRLGGRYLLSALEIDLTLSRELDFVEKFTHLDSAWDVYLYRVTDP